jgi:hypothetical protein
VMSALCSKADILSIGINVRFVSAVELSLSRLKGVGGRNEPPSVQPRVPSPGGLACGNDGACAVSDAGSPSQASAFRVRQSLCQRAEVALHLMREAGKSRHALSVPRGHHGRMSADLDCGHGRRHQNGH